MTDIKSSALVKTSLCHREAAEPFETLVVLAAGYLSYCTAYAGLRGKHTALNVTFATLAFGMVAKAVLIAGLKPGSTDIFLQPEFWDMAKSGLAVATSSGPIDAAHAVLNFGKHLAALLEIFKTKLYPKDVTIRQCDNAVNISRLFVAAGATLIIKNKIVNGDYSPDVTPEKGLKKGMKQGRKRDFETGKKRASKDPQKHPQKRAGKDPKKDPEKGL